MSSDLLFFTGFEGCDTNIHALNLFHSFTSMGTEYHRPSLKTTDGFLGGKCIYCNYTFGPYGVFFNLPVNTTVVYTGFHTKLVDFCTFYRLEINNGSNLLLEMTDVETLKISIGGIEQTINVPILLNMYFHCEVFVDLTTPDMYIKINGITEFTSSSFTPGTSLHRNYYTGYSFDNIWIHKSKSLGQCICQFSVPQSDGYYSGEASGFHPSDGVSDFASLLTTNDSDSNYIFSSIAESKFLFEFDPIPIGFNPVACVLQTVAKHITGGGMLYMKNLGRFNDVNYSGEFVSFSDIYIHSYLYRTNYDTALDGSELTREKLNITQFGSKLVEIEE